MSLLDSSLLCEFLTECQLPETVEIVEGYDSNESEEMSWSSGETVYLHSMQDVPQVLVLDSKGNQFCIPLNYPEKIFEGIPNRCSGRYESVGELIVDFPKYVRSLQSMPQSGVEVGDLLCLLETSIKNAGCVDLNCKVVGKVCPITLSGDQVGLSFEALEEIKPITIRDITDKHLLPTRARVRAGARRFYNQTNLLNQVMLEGLFTIQEIAQEKVLIVYTLHEKDLRVVKIPIDLKIRVRSKTSELDPRLFTEISRRIDEEVNIESTITTGNREASWFFDISDTEQDIEAAQPDFLYDEIGPPPPPRSSLKKETGPTSNQCTKFNKPPDNEARYVLPPQRKSGRDGSPGAPPVPKKPSMKKLISCHSQLITASDCLTKTTPRNEGQSYTERKLRAESQSLGNRSEKEEDNTGHSCGTQSAKKHQGLAFPKASKKTVSPTLCKQTSNVNTQTRPKEESPNSHHPIPRRSEAQVDRVFIRDNQAVSPRKAKPARGSVASVTARENAQAPSLPPRKPTPDVTKLKKVEEEKSPSSLDTGPPLENPSSRFQGQTDKEHLEGISVSEVCRWLTRLGLTEYVDRFKHELIDGDLLLELDGEMMLHLGMSNPVHRKKLQMFIREGWTPKEK